jgi:hypothetical protein
MHPMELLGDVGHGNLVSATLGTMLVLVPDRFMVCAEHTTCLEIVLDAQDGIAR